MVLRPGGWLVALVLLLAVPAAAAEANPQCDDCKFFPTVCDNIDFCVENCNIAPTTRSSCSEL